MGQILSQPVTEKYTESGEDEHLVFGVSSMQGWRVSMEDAHAAILNLATSESSEARLDIGVSPVAYFGVYDGHGGERTAQYAGERTHELVAATPAFVQGDWAGALINGFLRTDSQIIADSGEDGLDASGCAATAVVIVPHKTIVCGNAGDSRTVLGSLGTAKSLSFDHKPDNEGERSRICAGGGFVDMGRVNGNLALSRALGDLNFKKNLHLPPEEQIVTAYPDTVEHPLDDDLDEFVVLACDGIWDCMTSQEVVEFVRRGIADKLPLEEICELLMEECLAPESDISGVGCDNMTVCIVALLHKDQSKEQWFDMIAERVNQGRGPVAARTTQQIREQIENQRGPIGGSREGYDEDDIEVGAHDDDELEPSQLVIQRVFGGGDALSHLDPEAASSLLSRIGIHWNVHNQAGEDELVDHAEEVTTGRIEGELESTSEVTSLEEAPASPPKEASEEPNKPSSSTSTIL